MTTLRESNGVLHVTEVLALNGLYKGSDFFTDEAREYGAAVHLACEYYDKGIFDQYDWDPIVMPAVDAWRLFRAETGFRPVFIEKELESVLYRYKGKPDVAGFIGDDFWIIDRKTGADQVCSGYQTAGYHMLLAESKEFVELAPKRILRGCLELTKDARYKLHPHTGPAHRNDLQEFVCLLVAVQIRQKMGVL